MMVAAQGDPMNDAIEAQLAAYNAQDLDAFCACYQDDVRVEDGHGAVLYAGIATLRQKYAALFARHPENRAAVVQRMRIGPWVIDEEQVTGRGGHDLRAVAIYLVKDGRIASVRFLAEAD
jgi:hypothetical protein